VEAARGDAGVSPQSPVLSPQETAIYFESPEDFRDWLRLHHKTETEVWVGFWKKATGRQKMSWSQAVDQALCFGWIDGKLHRVDDQRHVQRFTPRRPTSNWSKVNIEKMAKLEAEGLVAPAGRRAFEARSAARSGVYSFERGDQPDRLPDEYDKRLSPAAREYLDGRPPWYRRAAVHWVTSAKREATREKRLATLIACSEGGQDVPPLRR
jgi:uncharacterized protein YdeI (YjbR/CyaY-like superfamily)